ncbi:SIMPL domain-containing protein [Patescibacteria group bacterium]|nr:SIMPL domain-containing protein [Patescibacteria group bacterium]
MEKKYFWWVTMCSIGIIALSAASYVYTFGQTAQSYTSFSASAEGKVVAVPDTAKFTFSVITEGKDNPMELQKDNSKKIDTITKYLKDKGIAEKDIKTESYYLSPQYGYRSNCPSGVCPPPQIGGYTINQTISVRTKDFDKASEVLGGVVDKGANSVSSLELTVDDKTALENQARIEAMKKAKDKARGLARAGGFRLGRLLGVDEYIPGSPGPMYGFGGGEASTKMDIVPSTPIEPGSQEIAVTVTLRYEIR